ncbi:hypothetical protein J6590_043370 [Homalodisca vitripennis]|nr:hypothetical protein J6590_043370 [Homalodisca vitripennis]
MHFLDLKRKKIIDNPLANKPAQKQVSEQRRAGGAPTSGGEWDKQILVSVLSCLDRDSLAPICLHCSYLPILQTYPGNWRFGARLAAKRQWPGQGIEQAGECRAVVGIL